MSEIKATVFIPTYYGEDNLDELFESLLKQKTDFEYEILVIDTSSKIVLPKLLKLGCLSLSIFGMKPLQSLISHTEGYVNRQLKWPRVSMLCI